MRKLSAFYSGDVISYNDPGLVMLGHRESCATLTTNAPAPFSLTTRLSPTREEEGSLLVASPPTWAYFGWK